MVTNNMNDWWHVAHTLHGKEEIARITLEKRGYEVYLPKYQRILRHARQVRKILAPLFPCYLFVRSRPGSPCLYSVNGTIGVNALVTMGAEPARVHSRLVDEIRGREDKNGLVELMPPDYRKGQPLRVTEGPFSDLSVIFESTDSANRVIVLMRLLGREVRLNLPPKAVTVT